MLATLPPSPRHLQAGPENPAHPVVAGIFHVHTTRSDGTGTVDEVAAAAARAGRRFVVFTDHGDGTRTPDAPSYRSGVLCIDGVEISSSGGHYAAVGMRPSAYPLGGEPRDVVEDVTRLGGFGVAAHPDSPKLALRWRDWAAPFDGVEWLNSDSEWRGKSARTLTHTFLEFLLRGPESLAALFGRPDMTLARFDVLTRQRRVVTLAGADAHARLGFRNSADPYQDGLALRMPSYESVFRTFAIRAQLDRPLTGRATADALAVRAALAAGHVYTAIDALATPPALDFTARSGSFSARAGDDLALGGPVEIEARTNDAGARVVLFANGRPAADAVATLHYRAPERPAVFRVEVDVPDAPGRPPIPWILSNPIYVGGLLEARRPVPRLEPTIVTSIGDVSPSGERRAAWTDERDPHSRATVTEDADATGVELDYRLAPASVVSQYVALVHAAADVERYDRLQFRARADRPMRVSVEVRVPSRPAGERWHRSVYLDQEPRDISVFLDDLRPIGPTSSYKPNLSKVNSVLFVIDTINARPGASGHFRLENASWAGVGR